MHVSTKSMAIHMQHIEYFKTWPHRSTKPVVRFRRSIWVGDPGAVGVRFYCGVLASRFSRWLRVGVKTWYKHNTFDSIWLLFFIFGCQKTTTCRTVPLRELSNKIHDIEKKSAGAPRNLYRPLSQSFQRVSLQTATAAAEKMSKSPSDECFLIDCLLIVIVFFVGFWLR